MGPILPLAPYELKHPTLSSGVSQPLSSIGNDFPGISRVTSTSGPVPTRRSNLSNTLPSPRRRQQMKEMLEAKPSSKDDSSGVKPQNVRLLFYWGNFDPLHTRVFFQKILVRASNFGAKNTVRELWIWILPPLVAGVHNFWLRAFSTAVLHLAKGVLKQFYYITIWTTSLHMFWQVQTCLKRRMQLLDLIST